jgi:CheY-like chemotaxis protein
MMGLKIKGLGMGIEKKERKTILIVDDTEVNIDMLLGILKNYDVIPATSGEDALSVVEDEQIDLILLDILMPGMDGLEVCRRLKDNPVTRNIPVIFITVKTDENSIEDAYDAGGVDYVTKPFKPRELLARIRTQLRLQGMIKSLQGAFENIKTLSGLLPICSHCRKIRDDKGYWDSLESYLEKHSGVSFTHGLCKECSEDLYANEDWYIEMKEEEANE